jgi:hypothetical protein
MSLRPAHTGRMIGSIDDADRVGAAYLDHLTDADLRALVHAEDVSRADADARVRTLRRSPGLVLDVLDRPATSAALLNLAPRQTATQFSFISPFLVFAAAIHRTAADLATISYATERAAPRVRVPLFDTGQLSGYLAAPSNRLFLVELLTGFSRTASGVTTVRTPNGPRRRRWNSLDLTTLAALLDTLPDPERPRVWRRLGDLSLFLSGVFPDAATHAAFGRIEVRRLARISGINAEPNSGIVPTDILEWLGSNWYRLAGSGASRRTTRPLPDSSERFRHARRVLNAATDKYLFPITADWFAGPS